jgi:hypothetical protein
MDTNMGNTTFRADEVDDNIDDIVAGCFPEGGGAEFRRFLLEQFSLELEEEFRQRIWLNAFVNTGVVHEKSNESFTYTAPPPHSFQGVG